MQKNFTNFAKDLFVFFFYLATPTTTMPMLAALEEELLVFCSRELGRWAVRLWR